MSTSSEYGVLSPGRWGWMGLIPHRAAWEGGTGKKNVITALTSLAGWNLGVIFLPAS